MAGRNPSGIPGVSTTEQSTPPALLRLDFPTPARGSLPKLDKYAHYSEDGKHHLAGYVEASRGCLHTCAHCPITPVYQGRFFIVPFETVMADVRQQVAAGAKHITFGDPDFLNGPGHALKIARTLHAEYPQVTFNFTTKVEHIIEHKAIMPEFARLGCTFIVSAFEATSDHILTRLNKGHSRAQMEEALVILTQAEIAPEPTWMPFTPWTSLEDYLDLLAWIRQQDLIPHTPAVQLAVRMLVPPGSALLNHSDVSEWAGPLNTDNFTHIWTHPNPAMDQLQQTIIGIAEQYIDDDPYQVFKRIEAAAHQLSEQPQPAYAFPPVQYTKTPPKLTENWFC